MKKLIFFVPLLIMAAQTFTACSFLESADTASVTFTIDSVTAQKIHQAAGETFNSSRAANRAATDDETEDLYLDIALKGDYTDSRTVPVLEGASVIFDKIPVKTNLYAEAVVYRLNDDKSRTALYSGKSEIITIKAGKNTLSIDLKGLASLSVTITIQSEQNDLSLSCTGERGSYTFSVKPEDDAEADAAQYLWYVDGEKIESENSSSFTLETTGMKEGVYEIEVVCGEKSSMATVTIE